MTKDYYNILQVAPSSTHAEIRAAYRKLAQIYHPDKNNGNKYSLAHFNLIKEAYEVLTIPELKEKYLQERWLIKSKGQAFDKVSATPENILQESLLFVSYLHKLDEYRTDKKALAEKFFAILSAENIEMLNNFNDRNVNDELLRTILLNLRILKEEDQTKVLNILSGINSSTNFKDEINNTHMELKNTLLWEKYKIPLIFLIVAILCTIIAFSS